LCSLTALVNKDHKLRKCTIESIDNLENGPV